MIAPGIFHRSYERERSREQTTLQNIFSELSKGNGVLCRKPGRRHLLTIIGSTKWSGTYRGKQAVLNELLKPLFAQFADQYTNTAHRFIAEDDYVVVECRGPRHYKVGGAAQQHIVGSAASPTASCKS